MQPRDPVLEEETTLPKTSSAHYRDMTDAGAAAAFQEFVAEPSPALARLREHLVADGQDPAALLDGTIASLDPL